MIKNRTAQLIFQTVYITLGIVGSVACTGLFDNAKAIRWDFYVHFTNLSNFFCIAIMFVELIQTIKKKENNYVTAIPVMKYVGMINILFTFAVFNLLLAGAEGRDPQLNLRVGSLIFHVILPIMFTADWFIFYKPNKMRWYHPFTAILFPAFYAVFIYTHAAILGFDSSIMLPGSETPLIYPYFFLNLDTQGVLGVLKWFSMFFVGLSLVGYVFFGLDRISLKGKRKKKS